MRGRTTLFVLLILFGLIITNFFIQIGVDPSYKNMSTDSGTFAYCGQVIRQGGLMYRDCWDNKPPGVYYLNAAAIWLGGANPFAIWLFQAIWLTLAVLAYFLILRKIWGLGLAALGSFGLLLILLYPGIFQGGNLTETYAVLPITFALGAFWAYLRTGKLLWVTALGLLLAGGFLLKPTYIAVTLGALAIILYLDLRQRSIKQMLNHLVLFSCGAAVPLILAGLYWVAQGDFHELWFAAFAHNVSYVQEGFSLSSLYGTVRMFLINQPVATLTLLVGMSFGLFFYQNARFLISRKPGNRVTTTTSKMGTMDLQQSRVWWQAGLALALVIDVAFLAAPGKNFGHYMQVVLPGMVASLLYLLDVVWSGLRYKSQERGLFVTLAIGVLLASLAGGMEMAAKERPSLAELKAFFTNPDLSQYQPNELVQYILDHSQPSEAVLIWAGHPSMNFLANRRSPTRYIFLQHLFTPTPYGKNGLSEFLQELDADPPALIVVQPVSSAGLPYFGAAPDQICPDCDPDIQQKMLDFHNLVEANYHQSFAIWDWVVFEKNGLPSDHK